MLKIGLTGGIATGKSHVLDLFKRRSVPTIQADQVSRSVAQPGQPAYEAICARYGESVLLNDRTINRAHLAKIIFNDHQARADLEAIVHPPVRKAITKWCSQLLNDGHTGFAVADIPLLFETRRND